MPSPEPEELELCPLGMPWRAFLCHLRVALCMPERVLILVWDFSFLESLFYEKLERPSQASLF